MIVFPDDLMQKAPVAVRAPVVPIGIGRKRIVAIGDRRMKGARPKRQSTSAKDFVDRLSRDATQGGDFGKTQTGLIKRVHLGGGSLVALPAHYEWNFH